MNNILRYCTAGAVFLMLSVFSSCKKDKDTVPDVYTDILLYSTDPAFAPLNAITGYTYLPGGSKGVLVYRKSQNEFMAYDRHCPYNVQDGNVVTVDASGLLVEDVACSSKFLITDGTPDGTGPAINPLKYFQTSYDGTVLHIFN